MNVRVGPFKSYELDWLLLRPVGAKVTALKQKPLSIPGY